MSIIALLQPLKKGVNLKSQTLELQSSTVLLKITYLFLCLIYLFETKSKEEHKTISEKYVIVAHFEKGLAFKLSV